MKFDGFNINTCREMISLLDVSFKCHILFSRFKDSSAFFQEGESAQGRK